jgi:hypothetical protein
MHVRKIRVLRILCTCFLCAHTFCESKASLSCAVPWIDSSEYIGASSLCFSDPEIGVSVNTLLLDFPALSSDLIQGLSVPPEILDLSDMTVPFVHTSMRRAWGQFGISVQTGAFSIPLRKTVIEKQTLSVRPETGWVLGAGISFRSLSVQSVFAVDSARLFAENTHVGSAEFSFVGAALSWCGAAAFWGQGKASGEVSAHMRVNDAFGFSFEGAAEGAVSVFGAAYSGAYVLAGGVFSVFVSAGILHSDALSFRYLYAYNAESLAGDSAFEYEYAPCLAARFGYERKIVGCMRLEVFRILGYVSGPRKAGGLPEEGAASPGKRGSLFQGLVDAATEGVDVLAGLDPVTLLLSGAGLTITCSF